MILFALRCDAGHEFEGWFRSGDDFEKQASASLVECASCGSTAVSKALMAPRPVSSGRSEKLLDERQREVSRFLAESVDVGDRFAEEARRMHAKDPAGPQKIRGTMTPDEAKGLHEDGISFTPVRIANPSQRN